MAERAAPARPPRAPRTPSTSREVRELLDEADVAYEVDSDARARPRLLHAHRLRVHLRRARRAERRRRRRALRRPRRAARRARRRPGMGWAAGIERILLAGDAPPAAPAPVDLFVALEARSARSARAAFGAARAQARSAGLTRADGAGRALAEGPARARRRARRALRGDRRRRRRRRSRTCRAAAQETLATDTVVHAVLRGLRDALSASGLAPRLRLRSRRRRRPTRICGVQLLRREMPKEEAMTQISRPFQIALAARSLVLGAVWLFALRGRTPSNERRRRAAAAALHSARLGRVSPARLKRRRLGVRQIYHGSAPGVAGSHPRDRQRPRRGRARPSRTPSTLAAEVRPGIGRSARRSERRRTATRAPSTRRRSRRPPSAAPQDRNASARRTKHALAKSAAGAAASVEARARPRQVVVLLFWNHNGAVDERSPRTEVCSVPPDQAHATPLARRSKLGSSHEDRVDVATSQVGVVRLDHARRAGVRHADDAGDRQARPRRACSPACTDAFSIEQAIDEARHGA